MSETIIAKRVWIKSLPNGHILKVTAKLYHLTGNARPHFSITADEINPRQRRDGGIVACGGLHGEIARYFPKLKPLIAMHLSDDDGAPMHAEENGWYAMAGALGGAMEQYHAGNSDRHHPRPWYTMDPRKPWDNTEYRHPTANECLFIWADHVRIGTAEALEHKLDIMRHLGPMAEAVVNCGQQWEAAFGPIVYKQPYDGDPGANAIKAILKRAFIPCRERHRQIIDSMRPRWKAEAAAALDMIRNGVVGLDR